MESHSLREWGVAGVALALMAAATLSAATLGGRGCDSLARSWDQMNWLSSQEVLRLVALLVEIC